MPVFTLQFERYEQQTAFVGVTAENLDEAVVKASEVNCMDAEWESTAGTDPRLYSILEGHRDATLATVRLPDLPSEVSWISVDLRDQWGRASKNQLGPDEFRQMMDLMGRYFNSLAPVLSDAGQAELDAERLRRDTRPVEDDALDSRSDSGHCS